MLMLQRTNAAHPIHRLRDEMEQLFGTLMEDTPLFGSAGARVFPALNLWEDDQNLYAEAELPGLKMDAVEVFVMGDELTLKGERSEEEKAGVSYHRRERGVGSFSRVVRLPVNVDADKVEANLRDGVLRITLPKAADARPRKIEVKGA